MSENGARVKGQAKKFSDLDLTVIGEQRLPLGTIASLADDFSESDLPCKVDFIDWASTSPEFRDRIRAAQIVLQPLALIAHIRTGQLLGAPSSAHVRTVGHTDTTPAVRARIP